MALKITDIGVFIEEDDLIIELLQLCKTTLGVYDRNATELSMKSGAPDDAIPPIPHLERMRTVVDRLDTLRRRG
jgi:hypothetical protein